jgi:RHH-type transcriptional regulator, proline utilization regulon repressor / proline dehydrogenase / delta 1-pyrroline-5-carboxylate dehydrogenase
MNTATEARPIAARPEISRLYRADESAAVLALLERAELPPERWARVEAEARRLVGAVRASRKREGGLDAFLHQYRLDTAEGVVLLCLAEALLRIPDADTQDRFIRDKMADADWRKHLGASDSMFVNASTWAMMLTGRILRWEKLAEGGVESVLAKLVARSGEPVIRQAVREAIRILGRQFVMGRNINEALERAGSAEARAYRHSFDMLGEAARTATDAERYFEAYARAIGAIGAASDGKGPLAAPGISIKLSALHPRYEWTQKERVMRELVPRLVALVEAARTQDIGVTIDSEEADRLDLMLDVMAVTADALKRWDGFGLALQAYQKRAPAVVDWLARESARTGRRWMVRLVKGAYWDTEIKRGQERGLEGYPVYTRKAATDVCYMTCAQALLANAKAFFPQFATHNALTIAYILELAGARRDFEFQRLHGMGESLYRDTMQSHAVACRVYAPVGSHEDLLPYLVRRLLENGANSSFVNRIADEALPVEDLVENPVTRLRGKKRIPNPRIPLPRELFGAERPNSRGYDLSDPVVLAGLSDAIARAPLVEYAGPLVAGEERGRDGAREAMSPNGGPCIVGLVADAGEADVGDALAAADSAFPAWDALGVERRASLLDRFADLLEMRIPEFMHRCIAEAGKTWPDALGEAREAIDLARYYAARARESFAERVLPGPTGERNSWSLAGRGVFVAISPWNFPLAIFTGQIAAALAAGNTVIAKPAEQTPLTAAATVKLFHEAGVPGDVLQLLPGAGEAVGGKLVADPRVAGIVFTGGTDTARAIQRALAMRSGPIATLIAETGGQNAMIVDSSALPEQVVGDVLLSAFNSAGQRCSALRVLCLQDDIADKTLAMLAGAMQELRVGDPALLETDIGPTIDADALKQLEAHIAKMKREAKLVAAVPLPKDLPPGGFYLAPHAFEIASIGALEREVFGPVLHVVRFSGAKLEALVDAINATGYGLTLGIHSRLDSTVERVRARARVGNIYVNRGMIGAVVGVQPFGGEGLSGTGPKAGGPLYVSRFAVERAVSINTAAAGGNAALMALGEE